MHIVVTEKFVYIRSYSIFTFFSTHSGEIQTLGFRGLQTTVLVKMIFLKKNSVIIVTFVLSQIVLK